MKDDTEAYEHTEAPSQAPRSGGRPSYQPSAAELRENLRLEGRFEVAIRALVQPAEARYVLPRKRKR